MKKIIQGRSISSLFLLLMFSACTTKLMPLRSLTPEETTQQSLFTATLLLQLVDEAGAPIRGVRVQSINPFFSSVVMTGQSGTSLIRGVFKEGVATDFILTGQGISTSETFHKTIPGGKDLITVLVRTDESGNVRFAALKY